VLPGSGSALLTLIAHATNGTIQTRTLWQAGADTTRMAWLYSLLWCLVASGLRSSTVDSALNRQYRSMTAIVFAHGIGQGL